MSTIPVPASAEQVHLHALHSGVVPKEKEEHETRVELTEETRDELLRKLVSKVDRIDQELGTLVFAVVGQGDSEIGIKQSLTQLTSDVHKLTSDMSELKSMLKTLLERTAQ